MLLEHRGDKTVSSHNAHSSLSSLYRLLNSCLFNDMTSAIEKHRGACLYFRTVGHTATYVDLPMSETCVLKKKKSMATYKEG